MASELSRRLAAIALSGLLLSGCLGPSYRVPLEALAAQTQLPPQQRGQGLRVTQHSGRQSPPGTVRQAHPGGAPVVLVVEPAPRRGGQGGGIGRIFDGDGGGDAGLVILVLAVAVTVASFVTLGIVAGIEASRYDGFVNVVPQHGVYLLGYDGAWYRVPLSELVPADVAASRDALIRQDEGPWQELGQIPLERRGFAWGLDLGAAGLSRFRRLDAPFYPASRLRAGVFPLQQLGIYASLGFVFGSDEGRALLNARYALEVHAVPLTVGGFSLGAYGQVGDNHRLWSPPGRGLRDSHALLYGGGLTLELDVSPHLGVQLRGGINAAHEPEGIAAIGEVSLGATIY